MNARTDLSVLVVPEMSFATIASDISVPYVESGEGEPSSLCTVRFERFDCRDRFDHLDEMRR
ncbi:MAG: hypothetical protein CPDRYMAC_6405 [uncultured Paraburkholderia sp.]|nr:MAG: hypothetical protein CPDRYDRY_6329 [uncultured Paraburkholderia sp.]CAH2944377.1 MAG: hypothetical protein CPDRYMAC_6405 [uncultured Paraburkholderia sp.]